MNLTQQENYLSDLLQCWCISMATSEEKLRNIDLPKNNLVVFLISPDGDAASDNTLFLEEHSALDIPLEEFFRASFPFSRKYTLHEQASGLILITNLLADEGAAQLFEAKSMAATIQELFRDELGISVSVGISGAHNSRNELGLATIEAVIALKDRTYVGPEAIIHVQELCSMALSKSSSELIGFIELGNAAGAADTLDAFYQIICERVQPDMALIRTLFSNLLIQTYQFLADLPVVETPVETEAVFRVCETINNLDDAESIYELTREYIRMAIERLQYRRFHRSDMMMERAMLYISEHSGHRIAVSDVANHLGVSAGYFSNLFRAATGKSFVAYLTEHRINRAKELLQSPDMLIADISSAVGFKDTKYFANTFKKLTGMTPTEYRESCIYGPGSQPLSRK